MADNQDDTSQPAQGRPIVPAINLQNIETDQAPAEASKKLTVFQTALVLVATNIGGGILGIPFAYYRFGIVNGTVICLSVGAISHISTMMYLKTKDMTPRRYESVYEIAYLLLGESAIFVVCIIQFMTTFALMILYYIIIGDTVSKLFAQAVITGTQLQSEGQIEQSLTALPWWARVLSHRTFSILLVGFISLLFIFKKKLEELTGLSYIFLTIVFLFIGLLGLELSKGAAPEEDLQDLYSVKSDYNILTAFSIFVFAYSFQFMVFPAYVELENRTNRRFLWASFWSIIIYSTALVATGFIAVYMFGSQVRPDLLDNISTKAGSVSVMVRTIYCFVLLFHLPYIFYTTKEYTLVLYDEITTKSLSIHLNDKLKEFLDDKSQRASNQDEETPLLKDGEAEKGLELDLEDDQNEESKEANLGVPDQSQKDQAQDPSAPQNEMNDASCSENESMRTEKSDLTYKKLSNNVQDLITLIVHLLILLLAIMIKDIATVFDFTGSIGCSFISYFFPGIGYLLALRRFGTAKHKAKCSTKVYTAISIFFIVLGSVAVGAYVYMTTLKLLGKAPGQIKLPVIV